MTDFANSSLTALLSPEGHRCACGVTHAAAPLRHLAIGPGVLRGAPDMLSRIGSARPFIVCDENTYAAAGDALLGILRARGVPYTLFVFPNSKQKIEPDERACGAAMMAFDPACDAVAAVGSGVVGDVCKVLSHATGRPQLSVATAPSMDGFASSNASMIQNGVKVTLYPGCPVAILCDVDIVKNAPMHMLHAGLGDMLAKYISIYEWRVSGLVAGEYYCENVAALVRHSLRRCVSKADGLMRRDPDAVSAVVEGLVLSGLAMTFAGISRPASGLEHYYSHLWEMFALLRGKPSELHGIQVGVGALLTLEILEKLSAVTPDRALAERAARDFSAPAWEARMRDIFGLTADAVIEAEKNTYHKNDPVKHAARLDKIIAHWPQILLILREEIPPMADIAALMRRLGMPTTPADIGIAKPDVRRALLGSREIRDKYLTSSLLWDIGLLDVFADAQE